MQPAIEHPLEAIERLLAWPGQHWSPDALDALEHACRQARQALWHERSRLAGLGLFRELPRTWPTALGQRMTQANQWSDWLPATQRPLLLAAATTLAEQGREQAAITLFRSLLASAPGDPGLLGSLERHFAHRPRLVAHLRATYAFSRLRQIRSPGFGIIWSMSAPQGQGLVLAADAKRNVVHVLDAEGNGLREMAADAAGLAAAIKAEQRYWLADWGRSRVVACAADGRIEDVVDLDSLLPEGFPRGPEQLCLRDGRLFVQCTTRQGHTLVGGQLQASGLACIALTPQPRLLACDRLGVHYNGGVLAVPDGILAINQTTPAAVYHIASPDVAAKTPLFINPTGQFVTGDTSRDRLFLLGNAAIQVLHHDGTPIYEARLESHGLRGMSAMARVDGQAGERLLAYSYIDNAIAVCDVSGHAAAALQPAPPRRV